MSGLLGVKFAVRSKRYGWLKDTCVGGSWSPALDDAIWYASEEDAWEALRAAEVPTVDVEVLRVK